MSSIPLTIAKKLKKIRNSARCLKYYLSNNIHTTIFTASYTTITTSTKISNFIKKKQISYLN